MLTVSMSVRFGLSNGAIDIVEDFINLNDRRPPPLSDVMFIFQIIPYSFLPQYPKIVPFIPVERKIDCTCRSHFCKRKLLLRLGWASTIHRFQGMTIGDGGVNK